jgi:Methyltransferase domain
VGEAIGSRVSLPQKPAVATLIDVLEHMEDPLAAMTYIRDLLEPGGLAFIFTGAADSLPWRLLANDYWYSSLPEHVSFFTRRWFEYAAEKTGMRLRASRYMSSARPAPGVVRKDTPRGAGSVPCGRVANAALVAGSARSLSGRIGAVTN